MRKFKQVLAYLKLPNGAEWDQYIVERGIKAKTRKSLAIRSAISVVLLYAFLAILIYYEPGKSSVARGYHKLAPYMVWAAPIILYFVTIVDVRRALNEKKFDDRNSEKLRKKK